METQNSAFDMQEQQGNIAVHRRFNRDEANFTLYPNSNLDDLSNVNLWREVAVLTRLAEAGVVGFQGVESGKQGPVLVFDDSGGTALSTLMAQQDLQLEECLCIGLDVALLLARIHQLDVVHKDISPEQILWNRERAESAISDFSIASDLGLELSNLRAPQNLQGNLLYMSPEQTGRINAVVDCRSDLYSMGATLYHLLLGHPPFTATDPMALVHAHIAQTPVDPATAGVPKVVAQILLKLLDKDPDRRYQTAQGLAMDLAQSLRQCRRGEASTVFELGLQDAPGELRAISQLYGREQQLSQLLKTFEDTAEGASRLLLVAGYSGVGKSALVHEVQHPILARRGYFCAGKFDQLQRSHPYSGVANAFNHLIEHLLTETEQQVEQWRSHLLAHLNGHGQLLIQVLPRLELIIGPQPAVEALETRESEHRFKHTFLQFTAALCSAQQPLVMFIDDMQWADDASLALIENLFAEGQTGHFLMICAYRDNEVDALHPFTLTLKTIAPELKVSLTLQPLMLEDTQQLLSDTLQMPIPAIAQLAALVQGKTAGNPFFTLQFLKELVRLEHLTFADHSWHWQAKTVASLPASDNVVELMLNRLQSLPEATREVLWLGACMGHRFDLQILGDLSKTAPDDLQGVLMTAIRAGLILPTTAPITRYSQQQKNYNVVVMHYRFVHDQIQQAAYALIDVQRRRSTHLHIARTLYQQNADRQLDDQLFEIVGHFNECIDLLADEAERLQVAQLNLQALIKARESRAYQATLGYSKVARQLMDESYWASDFKLIFTVQKESAKLEYINGHRGLSEQMFNDILDRSLPRTERGFIYKVKSNLQQLRDDFMGGLQSALSALRLFDINMPTTAQEQQAAIETLQASVEQRLGTLTDQDILNQPTLTDEGMLGAASILPDVSAIAFLSEQKPIWLLSIYHALDICLKHGNTPHAQHGFIYLSAYKANQGDYQQAIRWAQLAIDMGHKYPGQFGEGRALALHALLTMAYYAPIREGADNSLKASQLATANGDVAYIAWPITSHICLRSLTGDSLAELGEAGQSYRQKLKAAGSQDDIDFFDLMMGNLNILQQRGLEPADLEQYIDTARVSISAGVDRQRQLQAFSARVDLENIRLLFFLGDYRGVLALASSAQPIVFTTETLAAGSYFHCQKGLSAAQLLLSAAASNAPFSLPQNTVAETAEMTQILAVTTQRYTLMSASCPGNF
ncbi:MAG: putative ATPase [Paraglaciecola psychrophila]|jgi:predicted ATPase